jgi:hypothetical protein
LPGNRPSPFCSPSDATSAWHRLLAGLLDIDRDFLPTIDGELELPDGAGVSWRELAACLASGQDKVLAKSIDTVTTRSIAQLFPIALCAS